MPQEDHEHGAPFSAEVEEALACALRRFLGTWDESRHEELEAALRRLCTEAHEKAFGPERMLVAVKAAWARLPDDRALDPERKTLAFERVLNACLDAYYNSR